MATERTGARLLVDQLIAQGVNHVFCVPGESFLAVLDALHDTPAVRVVVNRHESGSSFMAEAYAKLTGQPGVAFVTRGPGACNAAIGVHTAFQDSTPLVLFVGQVGNDMSDREAFQEIDYRLMMAPLAKWVGRIDRAARIPEYVARAFQIATSGRPGPVVLALPEDMLYETTGVDDAACHQPVHAAPSDTQLAALRRLLGQAQRPLVVLGGFGWTPAACDNLRRFAEANALPVATDFRFQDLFDNRHPNYIGEIGLGLSPRLAQRVREADLLIAIGTRLGEVTTAGYTLLDVPVPRQPLVHVHPGAEELGRVVQGQLLVNAGMPQFAARLAMMMPIESPPWAGEVAAARAEYEAWQLRPAVYDGAEPALDLWHVIQVLRERLPADAILANGAGNFATWGHRFFRYTGLRTQIAPASGSMGYGVPAAIAAKLAAPEKTVVCLTGDGDFLMTGQELATATQFRAGVVVILFNNGMYGTIRMHQERTFPGRVASTSLVNPDFVELARSFRAHAARVAATAEFEPALDAALAYAREKRLPALIELACDPQVISPNTTLETLRQQSLAYQARR